RGTTGLDPHRPLLPTGSHPRACRQSSHPSVPTWSKSSMSLPCSSPPILGRSCESTSATAQCGSHLIAKTPRRKVAESKGSSPESFPCVQTIAYASTNVVLGHPSCSAALRNCCAFDPCFVTHSGSSTLSTWAA